MPPRKPSKKDNAPRNNKPERTPDWPPLRPLVPASDLYIEPLLQNQIYIIRNFFTANLCKSYISFLSSPSTGVNLITTPLKPKSRDDAVRVNDRFQVQDAAFAEKLWRMTALRDIICERRGVYGDSYDDYGDEQGQGKKEDREEEENARVWGGAPLGMNPNIRIYRYTPGQFFAQHYDESNTIQFPESPQSSKTLTARTTWTLLIYLTTTEGGETVFYPEDGSNAAISIAPEVGMALLHRHGEHCLLHEGKEVRRGEKWVIRSDLVVKI